MSLTALVELWVETVAVLEMVDLTMVIPVVFGGCNKRREHGGRPVIQIVAHLQGLTTIKLCMRCDAV